MVVKPGRPSRHPPFSHLPELVRGGAVLRLTCHALVDPQEEACCSLDVHADWQLTVRHPRRQTRAQPLQAAVSHLPRGIGDCLRPLIGQRGQHRHATRGPVRRLRQHVCCCHEHAFHAGTRASSSVYAVPERGTDGRRVMFHRLQVERLLAAIGGIQAGRSYAHRIAEIRHRRRLETLAPEQVHGCIQCCLAIELPWSAGSNHHTPFLSLNT